MRKKDIDRAVTEATRFLKAVKRATANLTHSGDFTYAGKESGALRRASLDLTRALADMRHPWREGWDK